MWRTERVALRIAWHRLPQRSQCQCTRSPQFSRKIWRITCAKRCDHRGAAACSRRICDFLRFVKFAPNWSAAPYDEFEYGVRAAEGRGEYEGTFARRGRAAVPIINVRGCRRGPSSVVGCECQRAVKEQSTRQSLGNSTSRTARLANRSPRGQRTTAVLAHVSARRARRDEELTRRRGYIQTRSGVRVRAGRTRTNDTSQAGKLGPRTTRSVHVYVSRRYQHHHRAHCTRGERAIAEL